jgi:hypothetical protein
VSSDRISARNDIAFFLDFHSIGVQLSYIRPYSLGVFMADERSFDPALMTLVTADDAYWIERTDESTGRRLPSGLAAKPIGNSSLEVDSVAVDLSLTLAGRIIGNILFIAGLLLITALITMILVALGLISSPNPIAVGVGILMLVVIANFVAEPMIEDAVEDGIREELADGATKQSLDDSPLIVYAGEGLAEAIARKALQEPELNLTPGNGRDRYREQFWQMVIVEPGRAALWARK